MRRYIPHLSRALLLVLLAVATATAQSRAPLTPADYGQWESLGGGTLSEDGRWLAFAISRVSEDGDLRLRSLTGDSTRVIPLATRPAFSKSSRWLAYAITLPEAERERLQRARRPVRTKMGLLDLRTGHERIYEDIASFAFSDRGDYLYLRGYAPEGAGTNRPRGASVIVVDPASGTHTHFGNIAEQAWQDRGDLLALLVDSESKSGNGVQLFDPASGTLRTLISSEDRYKGLAWRPKSDDLAFFREVTDERYEDETHRVLAWRGLSGRRTTTHTFDPAEVEGFPADTRVVDFRGLNWAEEGSTLYFGVRDWERKPERPRRGQQDTTRAGQQDTARAAETDPAGVQVWHARDVDIIPEQQVQANRTRRGSLLAAWQPAGDRFTILTGDLRESATPIKGDRLATLTDPVPWERERMFGPVYQDIHLVDIATGSRRPVKEKIQYFFGASPGGRYLLYLENDHYFTYDIQRGIHTNITREIPTSFVNLENDHTVEQKPPFRLAGWTRDDRSVVLYDKYDLWEVRPDGSRGVNLTGGAEQRIIYRYVRTDPQEEFIDPSRHHYLSMTGEWTKQTGYARLRIGRPPETLVLLDRNVARLAKAREAEVYAYVGQGFDESPNYYVGGPTLSDARRVSDTNPFQRDVAWGRSELVDFTSRAGRPLQGALFYPADYQPGRTYPMLVYVYETLSNTVHRYVTPSDRSPYNITVFNAEGYFVFSPDIVYRDRNPGLSAADCVIPAVEKVLESGMIDPARVGMVGHSWGAYQTAFLVTQTDLFSAAVAGAPLTNLISMYLSIYWNTGGTDARIFEISQGRMEVPFWEDLEAYMANSPVFNILDMNTPLLMAFGDEDGAVEYNQGVELYNAARRADKPLVMLVYPGENHSLRLRPNQLDYHRRILQWFDHYLKGAEPEKWIIEGVPHLERERELRRLRPQGGGAPSPATSGRNSPSS